ncbi:MAG: nitroreductase family protein [Actinobacteria bacterium]|nr:nitroreductase family protein [Actinomycetota bacterium]
MEFVDVVRARRMTRDFLADPLEPALVDELIDLARRAPSAGNAQGWDFVVLEGPDQTARYWAASLPDPTGFPWPGLLRAPVLVVPCADPDAYVRRYAEDDKRARRAAPEDERRSLGDEASAWPVPYWLLDTAMATENLLLAATDAGLGACYFGIFGKESAVRDALGIPEGHQPIGTVALGRRDPDAGANARASARRPRRPLADVVHRGGFRSGPDPA